MPRVITPTPRVNLRKKNSTDKFGYLYLTFRYNGNPPLSYPLGEMVEAKYWNASTYRTVFNKKYGQEYIDLNNKLDNYRKEVSELYKLNPEITVSNLKLELNYLTGKVERPRADGASHLTLFQFIEVFNEEQQNKKGAKRGTWKKFVTLKNHLKDYCNDRNRKLNFKNIDWSFRADFLNWLYSEPRNHSQNTAAKTIKNLKQVLNDATKRKYNSNLTYKEQGFSVKTVKTKNKIRLTFDEISMLINHKFSRPSLERTRDLFIVGCFTGLRYSDWSKVSRKNIINHEGVELLEIMTDKTDTLVVIPFLPELRAILEKYDYQLPELSLTNFNIHIKDALQAAGVDTNFLRIYSEAGELKTERMSKSEKASSHAARRSFATNFYDLGIPAVLLMQITGHTTEKQFFEYIDINQYEMALKFAKQVQLKRS